MKRFQVVETVKHDMTSGAVVNTVKSVENVEIVVNLENAMKERGLSQRDVARITGLRVGTVNNIVNNKGTTINKVQLIALMVGLRIHNLSEIIDIKFDKNTIDQFDDESEDWKRTKKLPNTVENLVIKNTLLDFQK